MVPSRSHDGAGVVNGMDLKSIGLWPRRFESRRPQSLFPGNKKVAFGSCSNLTVQGNDWATVWARSKTRNCTKLPGARCQAGAAT